MNQVASDCVRVFEEEAKMSNNGAHAGVARPGQGTRREQSSTFERLSMLATVIDDEADAVYLRDVEGICRMANSSLAQVLGLSTERIVGRCVGQLFPAEAACVIMEQEETVLADGIQREVELTIKFPQGECPYLLTHGVHRDSKGEIIGVFGRLHDIADRKKLEKEVIDTSEREMRRIAVDLHDGLCQELAAVSLISRLLQKKLSDEDSVLTKVAAHIADLTKNLAVTTRGLVHNLAPPCLCGDNFVQSLRQIAGSICAAFPLKCGIEGMWPEQLVDDHAAAQLYRIVHEAMHNAAKHSGGSYITVRLRTSAAAFIIHISDNGSGFTPEATASRGIGLSAMRYRADLIGATLKIDSAPGRGTTVVCKLSLHR